MTRTVTDSSLNKPPHSRARSAQCPRRGSASGAHPARPATTRNEPASVQPPSVRARPVRATHGFRLLQSVLLAALTVLAAETAHAQTYTLVQTATSIAEADRAVGITFRVERAGDLTGVRTLMWRIIHGTTSADDFEVTGGGVGLLAGQTTSDPFTVVIKGDNVVEPDETFRVEVRRILFNGFIASSPTITILNDDTHLALSGPSSVAETDTTSTSDPYTITLTGREFTADQVITWTIAHGDLPATDDSDFIARTGMVTFSAGDDSSTFTIRIAGDDTNEGNENFTIALSDTANLASYDAPLAVTLVDDDDDAIFTVTGPDRVTEPPDSSSESSVTYNIVRTGAALTIPTTVTWNITHGSTSDADFTRLSNTLNFAPGENSMVFSAGIAYDTLTEGEETFTLTASAPGQTSGDPLTVTIAANTGAMGSQAYLGGADQSVREGAAITVPVEFRGQTRSAPSTVTFAITGTVDASDYTVDATSSQLTFNPATATGTLQGFVTGGLRSIPIRILIDSTRETTAETLIVTLTAHNGAGGLSTPPSFDPAPRTYTIADNARTLTVTGASTHAETDAATTIPYTIAIGADDMAFAFPTEVTWTVTHGGTDDDDFAATTGAITFPTQTTFEVTVIGDNINEAAEAFTVNVAVADADADGGTGIVAAVTTLTDDDTLTVAIGDIAATVEEGRTAGFPLTLAGGAHSADVILTYTLSGNGIDPADFTDLTGLTDQTFTLPLAATPPYTLDVAIDNDGVNEGPETLTITLTGVSSAGRVDIKTGADPNHDATAMIVTAAPGFVLAPPVLGVEEGRATTYTVTLLTQPDGNVTVTPESGATATATVTGALTFTTANWNAAQLVTVTGIVDVDSADNTATISHAVNGYGNVMADPVVVTVTDTDSAPTFGATMVTARTYTANAAIPTLTLPVATGGNGTLSYALTGDIPDGLTYTDTDTDRTLAGTPTTAVAAVTLTWTATDADDNEMASDTATLTFTVTITETVPAVTIVPTALTVAEGGTNVYTAFLTTEPAGDVTVTPDASGTSGALTVPGALIFTTANWNTAQTVTVTANVDADDTDNTATLTHTVDGYGSVTDADPVTVTIPDTDSAPDLGGQTVDDMAYTTGAPIPTLTLPAATSGDTPLSYALTGNIPDGLTYTDTSTDRTLAGTPTTAAPAVTLTYTATDADSNTAAGDTATLTFAVTVTVPAVVPAVTIVPTDLTVDEGTMTTYAAFLTTEPASDVTVTPDASGTNGALTVSGALTFTTATWNTAQTVTVTAAVDADDTDNTATLTHTVDGYGSVTDADPVTVTIPDTDSAPDLGGQTVDDMTYTIGAPIATLTLPAAASGDAPLSYALTGDIPDGLTFTDTGTDRTLAGTPTTAAPAVTLTYTATDADANTAAGDTATLTFAVTITLAPGVTIVPTALTVAEGGTNVYTAFLTTEPAGDVTVTPDASGTSGALTVPGALIFTTANWNTAQTVTVTANVDADDTDNTATLTHTVDGYGSVTDADPVTVTIPDTDSAPDLGGQTVDDMAYTTGAPIPTLTLPAATSGDTPLSYALTGDIPDGLTFTDTGTDRTLTGTPTTAAAAVTLTYTATDADSNTAAGDTAMLTFAVTITLAPAVTIVPTDLTVDEGTMTTYAAFLTTEPASDVTVTPDASGTNGALTVSGVLTFTMANWNTAQTVTVTAAVDADDTDNTATLTHTVDGYGSVTDADPVTVTIPDTDSAPTFGGQMVDDMTYTTGAPIATLTLPAAASGDAPLSYALTGNIPDGLTYTDTSTDRTLAGTPTTAAAAVTLTYTATDADANTAAGDTATLTFAVTITLAPAVTIVPTALTVDEGTMTIYTAFLTTEPADDVTVTPDASGTSGALTVSGVLTFTMANWNTAQTVTVTAAVDADDTDNTATLTHTVDGYGSVTDADPVTVTIPDTDSAPTFGGQTVDDMTYTIGAPIPTLTLPAAASGDAPLSYALTGDIPDGLTFTDTDRTLAGTPTTAAPAVTLTYTATDADSNTAAGDTATLTFAVTVTVPAVVPAVTIVPTALTVDEGTMTTYAAFLTTEPASDVTVTPDASGTNGASGALTVSGALIFTTANWNTAQTVIVTAAVDADATDNTATLTHTVDGYGSVSTVPDVTVTIPDTDSAPDFGGQTVEGMTYTTGDPIPTLTLPAAASGDAPLSYALTGDIPDGLTYTDTDRTLAGTPTTAAPAVTLTYTATDADANTAAGDTATLTFAVTITLAPAVTIVPTALTVDEGTMTTYTAFLTTEPASDVTVTPDASGTNGALTVSGVLTFTMANWNMAQTVTVTAAVDADDTNNTATLTHTVDGYGSVSTVPDVTVTIPDTDSAPDFGGQMVEGMTYTTGAPIATLTLPAAASGDTPLSYALTGDIPDGLTYTDTDRTLAGTPTTVVAAVTLTYTATDADANTAAGDTATLTFAVTVTVPAVVPAVTIVPTALTMAEGGTGVYTAFLTTEPAGDVTVTPDASGTSGALTVSGALTFTSANWNMAQTVTVTATVDADDTDNTATLTHTVDGYGSVSTVPDVTVTIPDTDSAPDFGAQMVEGMTYTTGDPIATLTLPAAASGDAPLSYALTGDIPDGLTYTDTSTARTLAGTPTTAAAAVALTYTATDADANTAAGDTATLTFAVTITLAPGVTIVPTALTVAEGGTNVYTAFLTTEPAGDVTVTPDASGTSGALTVSGVLTFTMANWNMAQTVTVTATVDADDTDNTATLTHTVDGYGSVTAADPVTVTIPDTDSAPTFGAQMVDGMTYTTGVPISTLTLPAANSGDAPLSYALTGDIPDGLTYTDTGTDRTLTGTPTTAAPAVTLTYTATDADANTAAGDTATLTFAVTITLAPGVTIVPTALTVAEGGTNVYTAFLTTEPAGDVTVTPDASGTNGALTVSGTLIFTTANWNTAQTVTVTANVDADDTDNTATLTHTVGGYSSVTAADPVTVTIPDTDSAPTFGAQMVEGMTYTTGDPIATLTLPAANSGDAPLSYALTGDIPDGLTYTDTGTDRTLTGTPTVVAAVTLTYTATDADANTAAGDTATLTFAVTVTVPAVVPAVTIVPTALTVDEGTMTTYAAFLTTEPVGDVTVTPDASGTNGALTVSGTLIFTTANWNTAQTVTVTANVDADDTDNTATLTHTVGGYSSVTAADPVTVTIPDTDSAPTFGAQMVEGMTYTTGDPIATLTLPAANSGDAPLSYALTGDIPDGLTYTDTGTDRTLTGTPTVVAAVTLTYTATDADANTAAGDTATLTFAVTVTVPAVVPAVTIVPTALTVDEGTMTTYTAFLTTEPVGDVTVTPDASGTSGALTVSGVLTFTTANWNMAQTVTVTATVDADATDNTATLTHTVDGYGSVSMVPDVTVTIPNTDSAPTFGGQMVEGMTYTTGAPIATLTLPAANSGDTPLSYALTGDIPDGLTYTATGTDRTLTGTPTTVVAAVTLTYTATDADANTAAGDTATLTFAVTITLAPGVTIVPTALTVDEGTMTTYTAFLTTEPAGDVTVTPDASGTDGALTVSDALTFTTENWNTAQTVTVTANVDADDTDNTATLTHTVDGYGSVTDAAPVTVTIPDTDSAPTFGAQMVEGMTYTTGAPIATLTLPAANSGDTPLSYALTGDIPDGLTYTATGTDRTLTGTPTTVVAAVTLTYTATDADANTAAGDTATLTFAVTITLVPAVTIVPTALTVDEGTMTTYTAFLTTEPAGDVTVTPDASGTDGALTVSDALTFTMANWNTAQTVTVTANVDADDTDNTATLTHTVDGYGSVTDAAPVTVTIPDTDSAPTFGAQMVEGMTYTTGAPIATLTLPAANSGDTPLSYALTGDIPDGLTYTATGTDRTLTGTPTTVVAAVTLTYTATDADANTAAGDTATLTFAVTVTVPAVVPAVTIVPTALTVDEGTMTTYTAFLTTEPAGDVTVTPDASGTSGALTVSGVLTFTTANWNTAQTVTVTATEDTDATDNTATLTHTVDGYGSVTDADPVTVTIPDTDSAPDFGGQMVEGMTYTTGTSIATLTLPAATSGDAPLSYALTGATPDGLTYTATARTLTGTPTTAAPAVTLTYTATDADANTAAGDTATLTFAVTVTVPAVVPAVTIVPTALTVDEGTMTTYTAFLTTEPAGDVTVTPDASGTDGALTVSGVLTFTMANWNMAQTVTVTAAVDADATDNTATLTHTVDGYGSVSMVPDVTVTIPDTDSAPTFGAQMVDGMTYTTGDPIPTLTLPAAASGDAPLSYALTGDIPDGLTYTDTSTDRTLAGTPTTAAAAVTLTYTATDADANTAAGDTATLTFAVTVTVPAVVPAVTIVPTALTVAEGGTGVYTAFLTTAPASDVTVTPDASGTSGTDGALTVSGVLTFTMANWNTAQTVTVTAAVDADDTDNTATLTHTVDGYGSVPTGPDVTVTIPDTDSAPDFGGQMVEGMTYTTGTSIATLTLPAATSGDAPLSYALTGATPDGLTYTATARTLTGTPTTAAPAVTLTYTATDADANTAAGDTATLTFAVTVTVPAVVPAVTIVPTDLTVAEGGTNVYTAFLTTEPAGDVTVTPDASGTSGALTVSGVLTFTMANWNMAQTVTVTAAVDADDTDNTATLTHTVDGYGSVTDADPVTVTIPDTDSAPDFGGQMVEGMTYTTGAPIATLTLPAATSGDVPLGYALTGDIPDGLTFTDTARTLTGTPTTAAPAVTLTYTATDADSNTAAGDTATLTFAVTVTVPAVVPAVTIVPTALTVAEGGTGVYTAFLTTEPAGDVTVTPDASGTSGALTVSGVLTFTTANWNTAQTVTVTAAVDADDTDNTATLTHTVDGYGSVTDADPVTVTIPDTDSAPTFGAQMVDDMAYTTGDPIPTLTLPAAASGDAPLSYALTGDIPDGLTYTATARTLTGTPTTIASAVTLTYTATDTDTNTAAADTATLTFAVTITPVPGVTLTPTALTVAEGAMTTYTVALTTAPPGDVTVTPDATAEVTVSGALTFSPTTWNAAQTVTVTAAEDDADLADATATINHMVSGYGSVTTADPVVVTVTDNDTDSVPTFGPTTVPARTYAAAEAIPTLTLPVATGGNGTLSYTLTGATPTGLTFTATARTLTGTPLTAASAVTLTYTATDADANTAPADTAALTFAVTITPAPGVTLTPTALTVAEGATTTYTVALTTAPPGEVTVTPGAIIVPPGSVTSTSADVTVSGVLTFGPTTWNAAQTVTVTAAEDNADFADATATITHAVSGYGSVTTADPVVVTVTDNDTDSVPTFGSTTVPARTYTAAEAIPTLTLPAATDGNGTLSYTLTGATPDGLTFTATARTLTGTPLTAVPAVTLTYTAADTDTNTAAADTAALTFAVTITPALGVTLTPAALTVAEGSTTIYTVALTTVPPGNVTVTPDATAEVTVSGALTFSPTTWNAAQTVTVTAAEDDTDFADATATITHAVSGYGSVTTTDPVMVTVTDNDTDSVPTFGTTMVPARTYAVAEAIPTLTLPVATDGNGAPSYTLTGAIPAGLTFTPTARTLTGTPLTAAPAATLTYTATDTDTNTAAADTATLTFAVTITPAPGVTLAPTALTVTEGATTIYTVALTTVPPGAVTVTPDATAAVTISGALTFTPANWNTAQTVTVTTTEDADGNDDSATVTHAVNGYGSVTTAPAVPVTVTDNDPTGITISAATLTVDEGASDIYTVVLATLPGGAVTVTPAVTPPGHDLTLTPGGALTFTTANWNTAQTVTVAAAGDADGDDDPATITYAVSGYGSVTTSPAVPVTVTDDDPPGVTISASTLTVDDGTGAADYTLVLATMPRGAVTVTPGVTPPGHDLILTPAVLTFTPANWNTGQTVTVTAVADADSADDTATITYAVSGYGSVTTAPAVTVAVTDTMNAPDFGAAIVSDQTYIAGAAIPTLTLPVATGGNGALSYTLTPAPPAGLTLTRATRTLTGTPPATTPARIYTWIATDRAATARHHTFTITIFSTTVCTRTPAVRDAIVEAIAGVDNCADVTPAHLRGITGLLTIRNPATVRIGDFDGLIAVVDLSLANGRLTTLPAGIFDGLRAVQRLFLQGNQLTTLPAGFFSGLDMLRLVQLRGNTLRTLPEGLFDGLSRPGGLDSLSLIDNPGSPFTMNIDIEQQGNGQARVRIVEAVPFNFEVTWTIPGAGGATGTATIPAGRRTSDVFGMAMASAANIVLSRPLFTGFNSYSGLRLVTPEARAGVVLNSATLAVPENGMATYTVWLNTAPAGMVTVTPGITPSVHDLTFTPSGALTFTTANWHRSRTITVAAADDSDSADDLATITHAVSGYDSVITPTLALTVADDDDRTPDFGATTIASRTYTARMIIPALTLPTATGGDGALVYTLRGAIPDGLRYTVATRTLSGTPDAETAPVTLTYTVMDADTNVTDFDAATLPFTVTITPAPEVIIAPTALTVDESSGGNYTAVLATVPTGNVTVTPEVPDGAVVTVTGALTFSPATWNTAQTVIVIAGNDADATNDIATISHAVNGYGRINAAASVVVTVTDADTDTAPTFDMAMVDDRTYTEGETIPALTLPAATGGNGGLTYALAPAVAMAIPGLVFDTGTRILSGTPTRPAVAVTLTYTVTDTDGDPATLTFNVTVAAAPAVTISATTLNVAEDSNGAYTVALTTNPGGAVTVTPGVTTTTHDLTLTPGGALTFTTADWSAAQTVTVAAAGDGDADDDTATISHAVTGYGSVTAADVTVIVLDRDAPRVTISVATLTVEEESSGIYTIALATDPGGDVTITPGVTTTTHDLTLTPSGALTFTTADWSAAQTVTVAAAGDGDTVDDTAAISHAVTGYGSVTAAAVTVTVTDRDTPGITIVPTTLPVNEGDSGAYTVVLTALPTGHVTITPASGNPATASVTGALTFTTATWNTPQTVTVTGVEDTDPDPDPPVAIRHEVSGGEYASVTAADVTVTVTENDVASITIAPTALTVAEGAATTYLVVLTALPTGNVTVTPGIPGGRVGAITGALTFSVANWNNAQTVTITAATDPDSHDDTATITHAVSGYGGVTAGPVTITGTDTTSAPDFGAATVPDRTYTAGAAIPTLTLPSATAGDGALSYALTGRLPNGLTYTQPDRTLAGAPDHTAVATTVTLTYTVSDTDSDNDAADENVLTFTVTVMPSPFAVTLSPTALTVDEGSTTTYTVALATVPPGAVTVTPNVPDGSVVTVTGALTFAVADWNTARTVTVTAGMDRNRHTDTVTITHAVTGYGGATADPVTVTATDTNSAPDFGTTTVADQRYIVDTLIAPLTLPTATAGDGALSHTLTGSLPAGLTFTTGTLTLTGTPTTVAPAIQLTWTATDADTQQTSLTFAVAVVAGATDKDQRARLNRVILPEVARALADHRVSAIARRIRQAGADSVDAGQTLTLGGQSTLAGALTTHGRALAEGAFNLKTLLGGSDFVLPLNAREVAPGAGLSAVTLWGGGDYRAFSGKGNAINWDGNLFSAHLGADALVRDDLLAGVVVSWSEADLDYLDSTDDGSGDYEVGLTSVHPYIGWTAMGGRLDIWATAGYGWGELDITADADPNTRQATSDVTTQTIGAGGSAQVLESHTATVRIKGEALQTTMDVEGSEGIAAVMIEARRLRLGLEASHTHRLAGGSQLMPTLEVGMRHDAGDGRTGTGAEVGGGMRYTDAARGLTVESHGRVLVGHSGDYKDWGIGGAVRLEAGRGGHGLSFSLQPAWGATASRASQVWAQEAATTVAAASAPVRRNGRVDMNLGYGLGWEEMLVTPYGNMTLTNGSARAYRLGSRMRFGGGMTLNLEGIRQETAARLVNHGIRLQFGVSDRTTFSLEGTRQETATQAFNHGITLKLGLSF